MVIEIYKSFKAKIQIYQSLKKQINPAVPLKVNEYAFPERLYCYAIFCYGRLYIEYKLYLYEHCVLLFHMLLIMERVNTVAPLYRFLH